MNEDTKGPSGRVFDPAERQALESAVRGQVCWRGDDAYEAARGATTYRANKPRRYPALIVLPASDQDVVEAVRFANRHDLKVTARSGGHSWSASHIRDDVVLIDMSRMQGVEIDRDSRTFWANPGVTGGLLCPLLESEGLMFPAGHHPSPALGGFCMNGGFGWNSRLWGNGAHHILALDVVTAEGELIRADAIQNRDYWWAARGAGAGFFGVVTRMKLQAHPAPKVFKASTYGFDDAAAIYDRLMTWACDMVPAFPPYLEVMIQTTAHHRETGAPVPTRLTMAGVAITDDEAKADAALDLLRTCPVIDQADLRIEKAATNIAERYRLSERGDPEGYRYAADNIYTDGPSEIIVPQMRKVFLDLPSPRTHTLWLGWGANRPYASDTVLSVQAPIYVATYVLWDDPARDAEMEAWPPARMRELAGISTGGQMNDENMLRNPQRYFSAAAYEKLERLRALHDPKGRFASFMGNPFPA